MASPAFLGKRPWNDVIPHRATLKIILADAFVPILLIVHYIFNTGTPIKEHFPQHDRKYQNLTLFNTLTEK